MKVVKELKNYYYVEDIAAAALQLGAGQNKEPEEVRRRSLTHTSFIPLKTKESVVRVKGKPQPPARPAEAAKPPAHGTHRKPQHRPSNKPAPAANQPGRSQGMQSPKKPSSAHSAQPGRSAGPHAPKKPAQGSQPGRSHGQRPQRHHGSPAQSGDRRTGK